MTRRRIIALAGLTAAASAGALALPAQADTPTGRETQAQCQYPADVLDLNDWYLGMPTGANEDPTDIHQPELATFSEEPWFHVNEDCSAVIFRSAVDGVTTEGSDYPRSELRQMTDGGQEEAAWSADDGVHVMVVREAIVSVPNDKPHVVSAQVHGGDDDLTVFRLEGSSLYITNGDDSNYHLVTDNYQLGTEFEAKFVAHDGVVDAYYNGELQTTIEADGDGNYFKAGAYTQANCENSSPCDESNYGEVHISELILSDDPNASSGGGSGDDGGSDDGGSDDGGSEDEGGSDDGGSDEGGSEDSGSEDNGGAADEAGDDGTGTQTVPDEGTDLEGPAPDLATTGGGSNTPLLIGGGVGLLALGGTAVVLARRRSASRAAAA